MAIHRHTPAQRRRILQGLPPGPATRRKLPSQASPVAKSRAKRKK